MQNIYERIENFELNEGNCLEFVRLLCNYFSQKFKVPNCPIKLSKSEIPPARYNLQVKKQGQSLYKKIDEAIEISSKLLTSHNKARIIKLAAHEWMHFYDFLFRLKQLSLNDAKTEYKTLLAKSQEFDGAFETIKTKYNNKQIVDSINKLSAKEALADFFAQTFLGNVYKNVTNASLKDQILDQINKHKEQIQNCISVLKSNNTNEDCVCYDSNLKLRQELVQVLSSE